VRRKSNRVAIVGVIIVLLTILVCTQPHTQAVSFKDMGPYETYPSHNVFFSFTARTHSIWGNRDNVLVNLMIIPRSTITNLTINVENVTFIVSTYKDLTQNISRKYYYFPIYRSNFTTPVNVAHNISFTFNVPRDVTTDMMIGVRIFFNYTYNFENVTGVSEIKDVGFVKYKEYFFNILGFDFLTIVLGTLLLAYPIAYFSIKKNPRIKVFLLLFLIIITGLVILPITKTYISQLLHTSVRYKNTQYNISDTSTNMTVDLDVNIPERIVYPNDISINVKLTITKGPSEYNITGIMITFIGYFSNNGTQVMQQDANTITVFVINSISLTRECVVKIHAINDVNIIPRNIKLIGITSNNSIYEKIVNETNGITISVIHWWNDPSQYAGLYSSIVFIGVIVIGNGLVIVHWFKGKKSKEEYYL